MCTYPLNMHDWVRRGSSCTRTERGAVNARGAKARETGRAAHLAIFISSMSCRTSSSLARTCRRAALSGLEDAAGPADMLGLPIGGMPMGAPPRPSRSCALRIISFCACCEHTRQTARPQDQKHATGDADWFAASHGRSGSAQSHSLQRKKGRGRTVIAESGDWMRSMLRTAPSAVALCRRCVLCFGRWQLCWVTGRQVGM